LRGSTEGSPTATKTIRTVALFAAAFLVVSPGLYLDKFEGGLSIGVCLALALGFGAAAFLVTEGNVRIASLWTLLFAALLPNGVFGLALLSMAPLLVLARLLFSRGGLNRLERRIAVLLLYAAGIWLVRIGNTTDPWTFPLYLFLDLLPIVLVLLIPQMARSPSHLKLIAVGWYAALGAQLFPLMAKPIALGEPSPFSLWYDLNHGTLTRAHYLGVLLILLGVFLGYYGSLRRNAPILFLTALSAFGVYVTGSKHALLAAIAALLVFGALRARGRVRWRSVAAAGVAVLIVAGVFGRLFALDDRISLSSTDKWVSYISLSDKVVFVERTYTYFAAHPVDLLVGLGVGSYGSRVASSRATDVLYKEAYRLPAAIPSFTSGPYGESMRDLYTAADADRLSGSNVAGNPFSSVVGVVAELGLLGTSLYLLIYSAVLRMALKVIQDDSSDLWRALAATSIFAIPFLLLLGVMDAYFSQPSVTIPIWYLFGCVCARYRMMGGSDILRESSQVP
jgi:hypothetical protein